MKNTPCLECIYLRGDKGSYVCKSIGGKLEDSIALGLREDLPDCPFFSERQEADKFPPESTMLVVVEKPTRRKRRKQQYSIPDKMNFDVKDTYKEMLDIIRAFNKVNGLWPSAPQIRSRSRLRSVGHVTKVLYEMIDRKMVEKTDKTSAMRFRVGYKIVENSPSESDASSRIS